MNASFLWALLGLVAVSAAGAGAVSLDGSLPADIAAISLCEPEVQANAGFAMAKNDRKQACQTALQVEELLKISHTDTVTLKAMCDNVACTAALKALYLVLPNCRSKDWAFRLSVANRLEFCGIKPESLAAAGGSGSGSGGADADTNTTTKPAGNEFAPVELPTPVPTTTPSVSPAPTSAPKSTANSLYAMATTVVVVLAAANVVAL